MKYLRNLSLSLTLICALAAAVFAEGPGTPSCAPGEVSTPPCPAHSVTDDSTDPGEIQSPPAMLVVDAVDVTDIAGAVLWALSLF